MDCLYRDAAITVAVKPASLVSESMPDGSGFADRIAEENKDSYVGVVHRLDRGVGGVMVYANRKTSAAALSKALAEGSFEKEYLAVIHGRLEEAQGRLTDLLFHDRTRNKTFVADRVRAGVKEAILEYTLLETVTDAVLGECSLVSVRLLTGRTHQIRVQFASRRHPLIGDGKYGARDKCPIALFCHSLSFPHPTNGERMTFTATPEGPVFHLFKRTE